MYTKCKRCQYVCKCCMSRLGDVWPRCSICTNSKSEYAPSTHILYCPVDGKRVERPLYDFNGCLIKED